MIWYHFVSDLRQVCGYLWVLPYPPQKYTEYQDITEILLKLALQKKINNANNLKRILCATFDCNKYLQIMRTFYFTKFILDFKYKIKIKVVFHWRFISQHNISIIVCPANSSYCFGATALILCRMCIHIMEVCMFTGFWWSGGGIICVLRTHFIFKKSLLTKQLHR
jgi:hypothetical protein